MTNVTRLDLSEENLNQLIELVYQTLEDDSAWQPFFKLCCESVGAKMIHMFAHDKTTGTISYSNGNNMPVAGELAVLQKYLALDPTNPYYEKLKPMEWLNDHEVLSKEVIESSPFYYEFLSTYDTKYRHFTRLIDNKQAIITFGLITSPSQGPLPPECLRFLDNLLPHISRVCRLSIQNFIYSTQALVGHALVNKLRQPVILASVTGEIVHINDAGHELLAATDLISIKDGNLQIPEQYSQNFYDECADMEYTLKANQDIQPSPFKLLHMQKPKQKESLYTFYSLLLPQRTMGAFGLRPLVMMFFYHPESAPQIDASILSAAFDLTPSECKTAILLAEGLSQKEIAHALGKKTDTVRKQLQVIYQKTDTKQQIDLVRLMLNLPSNFVQEPKKKIKK